MAHAEKSPSGAEKWMVCPASVVLEKSCPDSTSEYSDEGTAAHALAAMCLTEGKAASAYRGRRLAVINGVYWPGAPAPVPSKLKGHKEEVKTIVDVDDEMVENVQVYLDNIRLYAENNDLFVEQQLPIGHVTGEEGATGTGDVVILADNGDELQLHDLKYGRGKVVSPIGNKQLMLYGLGALVLAEMLGYEPVRVRLVIHQPRIINAPQEFVLTVAELQAFAEEVKFACDRIESVKAYQNTYFEIHDKYFKATEAGCQWCKAKPTCKAIAKHVEDVVGADFEVLVNAGETNVIAMTVNQPDRLGEKLDAVDLIENWCKAVRAEVERRLLNNESVPSPKGGYKLVAGKKGRRGWSEAEKVEAQFKKWRIKVEDMYDFKLISPTSAEKLLKKDNPKRWEALQPEISQGEGKPHVAPQSDARPPIEVVAAGSEFEPLPSEATFEDLC